ncbi:MAG: sigma-70 family RNA polymerase sigma factor [Holophagales bacterium]|nr:sigma-70 family RNA polymerase sigma factor [Holophagales bacterium]
MGLYEVADETVNASPDSFARMVERHKDPIVNYLTRMLGHRDRAEDVAQETFVRFYQHRHRYREEGHLAAYLYRIATNLVRSQERRRKRWRLLQPVLTGDGRSPDSLGDSQSPAATTPQGRILASEEQREVTAAIGRLNVLYRAPLVLREIEGLSYREIARILKLSEGTVKSRLHRARELLRQELAPYWKGEC